MLTQRIETPTRFTRRDVPRLAIAAGILILALAAILGADILPEPPLQVAERPAGDARHRRAARARLRERGPDRRPPATRPAPRSPPQYDFTTENAIAIAAAQQLAFERPGRHGSTRPSRPTSAPEGRKSLLQTAVPDLSDAGQGHAGRARRGRLGGRPDRGRPGPRRDPADRAARHRGRRDADAAWRAGWPAGSTRRERMLAAELISPLVVPNSSFSEELTDAGPGQGRRGGRAGPRRRSARARSSSATARR